MSRTAFIVSLFLTVGASVALSGPCDDKMIHYELTDCMNAEQEKAEAELKTAYQALYDRIADKEVKNQLAETQKLWKAYIDSECEFTAASYREGLGYLPALTGCYIAMTQQRTNDLKKADW